MIRTPVRRTLDVLRNSALVVGALALGACSQQATLRPGPEADYATWMKQAAVEDVDGVEIVAEPDAWSGDPDVRDHVTPMRIVVENDHDEAVRIRYQDIALIASNGTRYNALPPLEVRGTIEQRHVVRHDPQVAPAFVYDGYDVAPYVHSAYPTMERYAGHFYHDADYYENYHDYWSLRPLPTAHMLSVAIPEGVVRPNGRVEGFVYFPAVDEDHSKVRLRVDVAEAERGRSIGEISIPFVVD